MSLDVYLTIKHEAIGNPIPTGDQSRSGIFIRENGSTREIGREEWNERFPGQEPITAKIEPDKDGHYEVYTANITHNLNRMAKEAGLYEFLWRPESVGISQAYQLIYPLQFGLEELKKDPDRFRKLNPPNGWGNYEGLVRFVEDYLAACQKYPNAEVSAWR